jgi:soluble lytic murein transglycosylase-like protein
MRMIFALSVLASVFVTRSSAEATRATTPELRYYADAYADHYGVPRALVHAIIAQESNWNPSALSSKGAAGLMQLMPATAETYFVRDRFSATENLSGGIQYLAALLTEFRGEMRLAVAAYYCGSKRVSRRGLAYRDANVVAYVESVRHRYQRELREQRNRSTSPLGGQ